MNKTTLIILLIIGAIFMFALGGGIGVFYQTQKDAPQLEKAQKTESAINTLSSKIVVSTVAYGEVAKIEGRNITLKYGEEILTINIKENSQIHSSVQPANLELKDIKVGDNLNINLKLLPEGQLEGQSILILPSVGAR